MSDEVLTFSDLRKKQKEEKRQDQLCALDDNFFLRVGDYLDRKSGVDDREYRNAKRVFDKIIGLRQEKIVKNARIAVKSKVNTTDLNLLPREQELYRNLKQMFQEYSDQIDDVLENGGGFTPDETTDDVEEELEEDDEDYEKVEIISQVPEFMGTDLESYGPFEEGEKVELPAENAEILVNRGNAERIEG